MTYCKHKPVFCECQPDEDTPCPHTTLRDRVIALADEYFPLHERTTTQDTFALAVAAMAVAHEREACAEACLRAVPDRAVVKVFGEAAHYATCAAAIRARKGDK